MQYEAPAIDGRIDIKAQLGVIAIISGTTEQPPQPHWRTSPKPADPRQD